MTFDSSSGANISSSSSDKSTWSNGANENQLQNNQLRHWHKRVTMSNDQTLGGSSGNQGNSPSGGKIAIGRCGVCGDKAYFHNFNALTCQACKAFFRRNAKKYWRWKCPFKDSCQMNDTTRKCCRSCRIKKCFEIGMRPDLIRSPTYMPRNVSTSELQHQNQQPLNPQNIPHAPYTDSRHESSQTVARDELWLESPTKEPVKWPPPTLLSYLVTGHSGEVARKEKPMPPLVSAQTCTQSQYSSEKCSTNEEPNSDQMSIPLSFIHTLDLEEETKLYELLFECNLMETPVKLDDQTLISCNDNNTMNPMNENCDTDKPFSNILPFNHWLQFALSDVTHNIQKVKSFLSLDVENRMNVMKHVTLQIFLLKMICNYREETNVIEWMCSAQGANHVEEENELSVTLQVQTLKTLNTSFYENFIRIINILDTAHWRSDKKILTLISAIIIFDPSFALGHSPTTSPSSSRSNSCSSASLFSIITPDLKITCERDVYVKILKKYLSYRSQGIGISEEDVNVTLFQTLFGIKNLSAILESIDLSKQTFTLNVA